MKLDIKYIIVVMLLVVLISCGDKDETAPRQALRPVRYITVSETLENNIRFFSGVSKAATISRISFRVGGKLEKVYVKDGDFIQKNALIAAMDSSDAMLQYEKAQSSLAKSKVYMDTAESSLIRIKSLYENDNVSLNEYEAAKEKFANSKAASSVDKKNLDLKKKELGYFKVYAPISGIVSGIAAETGENVSAGQVILEIHTMDAMEVRAGIPDSYISGVRKDGPVEITFNPLENRTFKGRISEVSYNINADTSTYPVMIRLTNSSSDIRPGMPATIAFDFGTEENRPFILVPIHSVGEDDKGHFVFLVTPKGDGRGIVEKKQIEIGKMTSKGFEVLEGITPGDKVVTAGITQLSNGIEVKMDQGDER